MRTPITGLGAYLEYKLSNRKIAIKVSSNKIGVVFRFG